MEISPEILLLIEEIKSDRVHGASELARQAVSVLRTAAERSVTASVSQFLTEQKAIAELLTSARPAMAPLFNMVNRLLKQVTGETPGMDLASIKRFTVAQANGLIQGSIQAVERIAGYTSGIIADGDRIMTHSYSSTVVASFREAGKRHRNIQAIVTRSGASRIGEKTAHLLASFNIPVTFIDDTAVGLYIGRATRVITGADRICADGQIVNGIGTCQLALAAAKAGVPFYILCETLKFDPRFKGDEVELEEKEPAEVAEHGRLPPGVEVRNPYFDVTPVSLVTGVVTEEGLLSPQEVIGYIQRMAWY